MITTMYQIDVISHTQNDNDHHNWSMKSSMGMTMTAS